MDKNNNQPNPNLKEQISVQKNTTETPQRGRLITHDKPVKRKDNTPIKGEKQPKHNYDSWKETQQDKQKTINKNVEKPSTTPKTTTPPVGKGLITTIGKGASRVIPYVGAAITAKEVYDNWDNIKEVGEKIYDTAKDFIKGIDEPTTPKKRVVIPIEPKVFNDEKEDLTQVEPNNVIEKTDEKEEFVLAMNKLETPIYETPEIVIEDKTQFKEVIKSFEVEKPKFLEGLERNEPESPQIEMGEPSLDGNDGGDDGE